MIIKRLLKVTLSCKLGLACKNVMQHVLNRTGRMTFPEIEMQDWNKTDTSLMLSEKNKKTIVLKISPLR